MIHMQIHARFYLSLSKKKKKKIQISRESETNGVGMMGPPRRAELCGERARTGMAVDG
jgi:hypothetical protein